LVFATYPSQFCSFFLRLFPVFVLSTNFPIIVRCYISECARSVGPRLPFAPPPPSLPFWD
jgi:hypothetical protein